MTGSTRSSEGLDPRRRRLLFRCWHRGTKEMDLLLGSFADACLEDLTDEQLDDLEHVMGASDTDLFSWMSGGRPVPAEYDTPIFNAVVAFHRAGGAITI